MSVSTQGTQITSSVGRIVWGNPLKATQKKDPVTKQVILKDGQPVIQHIFGLAIPKADFIANEWPAMAAEAAKGYPQGVPQKFSWKYDDGDGRDSEGKPFADREGYAGCYVLTIASNTGFAPSLFRFNPQTGGYDQLTEDDIKTGDFVRVALNFVVNVPSERTHTPSLYVNPQGIEFIGYGKAIMSAGINPMAAFGGQRPQLPAGASEAPQAGDNNGVGMPGTGPAPQPAPGQPPQMPGAQPAGNYGMPGAQPAPQGYPQQPQQPAPQGYPAPAHDFVQNAGQPPAPQGYPQQPQQPAPGNYGMPGAQPAPQGYPQPQPQQPAPGQPPQMPAPGGMPGGMPPR